MPKNTSKFLLTGPPGCGKTTLVMEIVQRLRVPARGFYTEEVRTPGGERIGFDVVTLDGRRGPLARVAGRGPHVGRYGVDLRFLEEIALKELEPRPGVLGVVDEIGKMECLSDPFVRAVTLLLRSPATVLGTVALKGDPFIRQVRQWSEVELVRVTWKNRDGLVDEIACKLLARR